MKRGFAFALLITLTLITVARSQTGGSADYFLAPSCWRADNAAPCPDVVRLANQLLREKDGFAFDPTEARGGLWVSGDVTDAIARLRWIAGSENAELLQVGSGNQVTLNAAELGRAARVDERSCLEAAPLLARYISANEGLLLLVQVIESSHRYLLHIGRRAPTAAGLVSVASCMNLDLNFDSRINPYRSNGVKLPKERPPSGFDSVVAINPTTRWFNMRAKLLIPPGSLAFHELAEAYAKVEFGFDYLAHGSCPGAHKIALDREEILITQRPLSNGVATGGVNRVLISDDKGADLRLERDQ